MWAVFIGALFLSAICGSVAIQTGKMTEVLESEKKMATMAIMFKLAIGILLYLLATYSIQFYEYIDLDFWDYGQITVEGVLYFGMKYCGILIVISGLYHAGAIAIKDIKNALLCNRDNAKGQ